jgi:hypothetical protein
MGKRNTKGSSNSIIGMEVITGRVELDVLGVQYLLYYIGLYGSRDLTILEFKMVMMIIGRLQRVA